MMTDWSRFNPATFDGVTEDEARKVLPRTGTFIRDWMEYFYQISDAPMIYSLGGGLTMIAPLIPEKVKMPGPDRLRPNLFTLLIGPPSGARKTFAVDHAEFHLTEAKAGMHILSSIGSAEAIADEVIAFPNRLITASEGGNFLQHTIGGRYGGAVRWLLCDIYDSKKVSRVTIGAKTQNKIRKGDSNAGVPTQDNPRVSMLMACTKAAIEGYTFKEDWAGGFLSRYIILWAQRERNFSEARDAHEDYITPVRAKLAALKAVTACGECSGMEPGAKAFFSAWQARLSAFAQTREETTSGIIDRAQQNAKKTAMILAYDRHVFLGQHIEEPWALDMEDVRIGCTLGEFSVKSALHVEQDVTDNEHGQRMNRLVNLIRKSPHGARTVPDLLRQMNRPQKMIQGDLDTLVAAERLIQSSGANVKGAPVEVYAIPDSRWLGDAAVALQSPGGYGSTGLAPIPRNDDDSSTRH